MKASIKSSIKQAVALSYYRSGILEKIHQGKVLILMYHRVLPDHELNDGYVQPGMYVRRDTFEKHMGFLKDHFEVLSFRELFEIWVKKEIDNRQGYCVVTFDDGWLDNYQYAFPVLKAKNIPATIFLPTGYIGTDQWFWPDKLGYILHHYFGNGTEHGGKKPTPPLIRESCNFGSIIGNTNGEKLDAVIEKCKKLSGAAVSDLIDQLVEATGIEVPGRRRLLNWQEIEEMSRDGIAFGSHSSTHRILTELPADQSRVEIEDSLSRLRTDGINHIPVFCYPNGSYNREVIQQVKKAGYRAAVSTRFGLEGGPPHDLFCLKRIGIHDDISRTIPLFAWRISGLGRAPQS